MKIGIPFIVTAFINCLIGVAPSAFSQGSLTPPGVPAPTMKSLDQIEPRTAIPYNGYDISAPGSYYVTNEIFGNAAGLPGSPYGIQIDSDNVTIDLNGYTLQGVSGSYSGIFIRGSHSNIVIRNGIVTGWGADGVGFNYPTAAPQSVTLEKLTVSANGHNGISMGNSSVVRDCVILNNQGCGILVDGNGSQVINNTLAGNNTAASAGSGGIVLEGSNNRIDGNHITVNSSAGYGILLNYSGTSGNIVVRNTAIGNGGNNYSPSGGNDLGPVGNATSSTSPWANISQ